MDSAIKLSQIEGVFSMFSDLATQMDQSLDEIVEQVLKLLNKVLKVHRDNY